MEPNLITIKTIKRSSFPSVHYQPTTSFTASSVKLCSMPLLAVKLIRGGGVSPLIKTAHGTKYEPDATNNSKETIHREVMASNLLPRDTCACFHGKSTLNEIVSFLEISTHENFCMRMCHRMAALP